jgi:hypothetical protein
MERENLTIKFFAQREMMNYESNLEVMTIFPMWVLTGDALINRAQDLSFITR